MLLSRPTMLCFITDFRYTEQAEKEIEGFRIVQHTTTIIEEVAAQAKNMNCADNWF